VFDLWAEIAKLPTIRVETATKPETALTTGNCDIRPKGVGLSVGLSGLT